RVGDGQGWLDVAGGTATGKDHAAGKLVLQGRADRVSYSHDVDSATLAIRKTAPGSG
ncbi:MAG: hypothetical protein JWN96_2634, partial [Mycobacterium sp.]|nr:hypothetical protein [Mycobacterium sp.]